jgi:hypothetical protein
MRRQNNGTNNATAISPPIGTINPVPLGYLYATSMPGNNGNSCSVARVASTGQCLASLPPSTFNGGRATYYYCALPLYYPDGSLNPNMISSYQNPLPGSNCIALDDQVHPLTGLTVNWNQASSCVINSGTGLIDCHYGGSVQWSKKKRGNPTPGYLYMTTLPTTAINNQMALYQGSQLSGAQGASWSASSNQFGNCFATTWAHT